MGTPDGGAAVRYDDQDDTSSVEALDPEAALGIIGDDPTIAVAEAIVPSRQLVR